LKVPLSALKMVRPERFELPTLWFVARCSIQLSYGRSTEQLVENFDYSRNSAKVLRTVNARAYSEHLMRGPKYFLCDDFHQLWHDSCECEHERKSFSPLAIPTMYYPAPLSYFQVVGIGKSSATIIGRRSGAQRGALEDKLRPEVFLDAPCIFPSTPSSPGRRQPSPSFRDRTLSQHKFFPDIQSRLPQQSSNHRLFEA
jgi:hypothetical protein